MERLRRGSRDRDAAVARSSSPEESGSFFAAHPPAGGREEPFMEETNDYLPGARHPLHATSATLNGSGGGGGAAVPRNRLRELAVMDLPEGVVVFPGDSLPLRVRGPWEKHLSHEIERQRLQPSLDVVQFGVLTPSSFYGDDNNAGGGGGSRRRRSFGSLSRQSWTRQAWGPRRLSRYSYRLTQELQRLADSSSDDDNEASGAAPGGRGQADGGNINDRDQGGSDDEPRGGGIAAARSDEGRGAIAGGNESNSSDSSDASPQMPQLMPRERPAPARDSEWRVAIPINNHSPSRRAYVGGRGQIFEILMNDSPLHDYPDPWIYPTRPPAGDDDEGNNGSSVMGRIGTLVTVLYTHGDDVSGPGDRPLGSSHVWRQHGHELIITARATGRFRIVRAAAEASAESGPNAPVRRYLVEELTEEELSRPSLGVPPMSGGGMEAIRNLARTTPIPEHVWRGSWPDHLASQILHGLNHSPSHRSLVRSMRDEHRGPLRLSYWLASNMALQQHEKVLLLEMLSPVERLRWIMRRLKDAEQSETVLQCKRCACPITRGSHAFSVGGAQGTTGNYVNEYGHVHQTMTFYTVDEDEVSYTGGAETRDSWFPGYSWTIMNCGFCQAHLGWKFRLVDETAPATEDRPTSFFGLSTSQVASIVPEVARVRRRGSPRH